MEYPVEFEKAIDDLERDVIEFEKDDSLSENEIMATCVYELWKKAYILGFKAGGVGDFKLVDEFVKLMESNKKQ